MSEEKVVYPFTILDCHPVEEDGKWCIVKNDGERLTDPIFNSIRFREVDGIRMLGSDDKWILLSNDGKLIPSPVYESIDFFSPGMAIVKLQGKYGLVKDDGTVILPAEYSLIMDFKDRISEEDGLCKISKRGIDDGKVIVKQGYINKKGEIVIEPVYDFLGRFDNGIAKVLFNDEEGYINMKGELFKDADLRIKW